MTVVDLSFALHSYAIRVMAGHLVWAIAVGEMQRALQFGGKMGRRNGSNDRGDEGVRDTRIVLFGLLAVGGSLSRRTFYSESNMLVKLSALLVWESLFLFVVSQSWRMCRLLDNMEGTKWFQVWRKRLQGWCKAFCTSARPIYHIFVTLTKFLVAWRYTMQASRRFFQELRREDPVICQAEHSDYVLVQVVVM